MPLSYDFLNDINKDKLLDYLELREIAHKHVAANLSNSKEYLDQALSIYDKDYELYRLYGEYYANNALYTEAISSFTKASSLSNDEYYCSCRLALLLIRFEEYDKALIYLKKVLKSPNSSMLLYSKDFLLHYAICSYYTKDLITSKKYFEKLTKLMPDASFIKIYLANITLRLNKKTKKIIDIKTLNATETTDNIDKTNSDSSSTLLVSIKLILFIFIIEIILVIIYLVYNGL